MGNWPLNTLVWLLNDFNVPQYIILFKFVVNYYNKINDDIGIHLTCELSEIQDTAYCCRLLKCLFVVDNITKLLTFHFELSFQFEPKLSANKKKPNIFYNKTLNPLTKISTK